MSNPFKPDKLPISNIDWASLIKLIGEANAALARFDGLLHGMVNPEILLSPLTLNEAVLSSRIEGTNATNSEVLEFEAGSEFDPEKTNDIQEIKNYRKALLDAETALEQGRPISLSLIKSLHQTLMQGVRGKDKRPGEFRSEQNWIGPKNCKMERASFIPPSPLTIHDHLEDWISHINLNEEVLSQLAVVHAQFEIIHPFMDGNGRIGRILIPLFLYQKKMLHRPMFFLSEYLEERRDEYCDSLGHISAKGDWVGWLNFFLEAVRAQAIRNTNKVKGILSLYEMLKVEFQKETKSQFAQSALDAFFQIPILNTNMFMKLTGITNRTTLGKILSQLESAGFIKLLKEASGRKSAVYALPELLNIAEGKNIL
ncbi:MAG: cell filamentation protein Fic [Chlamydiae bacterium CG10_big_fil_rev_8_21_14_0_10_35_9]|nr:MAG: cell filamentation protein Fic [Chlamydiae bacterium CG10_big_fil_rev_8_21_14_0_10_35_9]